MCEFLLLKVFQSLFEVYNGSKLFIQINVRFNKNKMFKI